MSTDTRQRGFVKLTREDIDAIVEGSVDQADMTIGLYRHVFPDWDEIKSVDGYPVISEGTSKYILRHMREKGWKLLGVWFNNGFSTRGESYGVDWMVNLERVRVEYQV